MSERVFQDHVVQFAGLLGWRCYHTHDSRRSQPGFPDLVLVRDRIVYAELKAESGAASHAQRDWLQALREADGEAYLWKPGDWAEIQRVLGKKAV